MTGPCMNNDALPVKSDPPSNIKWRIVHKACLTKTNTCPSSPPLNSLLWFLGTQEVQSQRGSRSRNLTQPPTAIKRPKVKWLMPWEDSSCRVSFSAWHCSGRCPRCRGSSRWAGPGSSQEWEIPGTGAEWVCWGKHLRAETRTETNPQLALCSYWTSANTVQWQQNIQINPLFLPV